MISKVSAQQEKRLMIRCMEIENASSKNDLRNDYISLIIISYKNTIKIV